MEEVQKSIQLINFSDSIFDADEREVDKIKFSSEKQAEGETSDMLSSVSLIKYLLGRLVDSDVADGQSNVLGKSKHVKFDELLFTYFNQYEKEEEVLMEILVVYSPFVVSEKEDFELMTRKESDRVKGIEMKCFGSNFGEYKLKKLLNFDKKIFSKNRSIFDFEVLCKKISCQLVLKGKNFDAKRLAKTISIIEAAEYLKLDFYDFYKNRNNSSGNFILIFNKLTNFLISEILLTPKESAKERKLIIKRILKLAKELAKIGALNSLKACTAALESNSIHRLKFIKEQAIKYQKRFEELSSLTSSEKNFKAMREKACLIPWMGIILRDFTFIKELIYKSPAADSVNVPLGHCLRKLLNSMAAAREACDQFLKESDEEELKNAAITAKWLKNVEIFYETEESQYERSLKIAK